VPFYGFSTLCADDDNIRSILNGISKKIITYGIKKKADARIQNLKMIGFKSVFEVSYKGKNTGTYTLNVPGVHNVLNSLAVIGTCLEIGISSKSIKLGLKNFTGAQKRFEKIGEIDKILVVDDYGHHPTEIMATLKAAGSLKRKRVLAVFQPHRYSRSKLLYEKFGRAFNDADAVIVTDIYPAGEKPMPNVSAELIVNSIKNNHKNVIFIKDKEDIPAFLMRYAEKGDIVLTLGAGDIRKAGEEFYKRLKHE
jgi:UDP-N-acetylmuramate--alanine ligase